MKYLKLLNNKFSNTFIESCRTYIIRTRANLNETATISGNILSSNTTEVPSGLFRCSVNDPLKHDVQHIGKFYKINDSDYEKLDPSQKWLRPQYTEQWKAFNEKTLMIRKPAIEILNYVKNLNLSNPTYRILLYSDYENTGKRSTVMHVMHHCLKNNWLIISLPRVSSFFRYNRTKYENSTYKLGRVDTPVSAAKFLQDFLAANMNLLKKLNLKTTKDYIWSEREDTKAGTSLIELIEFGNTRVKYATDICGALVREIKLQAKEKNIKVLIAIDEINSFYGPTRLARNDKSDIFVDEVSLVHNFKKLLKTDWTNAIVVGTISGSGHIIQGPRRHKKHYDNTIPVALRRHVACKVHYEGPLTPAHLLKKEGFYDLEPFIPIEVPKYTDEELRNYFEYYKERSWLQNPLARDDEAREELKFLSGNNPYEFMRICGSL